MPAAWDDKAAFSERLRLAMKRAPRAVSTAVQLAHEFNLRHHGDSVTDQAVQKWLLGKARPSPDKLETLAEMLNVSAFWLRNGTPPPSAKKAQGKKATQASATERLSEAEEKHLAKLRTLSSPQARLIFELVEQLALERELAGQ